MELVQGPVRPPAGAGLGPSEAPITRTDEVAIADIADEGSEASGRLVDPVRAGEAMIALTLAEIEAWRATSLATDFPADEA